jgi:hypothetical protein
MMHSIVTNRDLAIELYDDGKITAPGRKVQVEQLKLHKLSFKLRYV